MGRRNAFTLVELLVCLAILAVLLALFLPVVASVRRAAMNTVCTSRLRDLAGASNFYRNDYGRYPKLGVPVAPGDIGLPGVPAILTPQTMNPRFLNLLCRYLNFPSIGPALGASDLPPMLQCPMVEDADGARDELIPLSDPLPTFYTGYAYFGRVDEPADGMATAVVHLLKPKRAAVPRNSETGVLWADDVHYTYTFTGAWSYAHRVRPVAPGPFAQTYASVEGLGGQHRAFTDGHVEWEPREGMNLGVATPEECNRHASLKINEMYFSWF